jgi:hypothetical protein
MGVDLTEVKLVIYLVVSPVQLSLVDKILYLKAKVSRSKLEKIRYATPFMA